MKGFNAGSIAFAVVAVLIFCALALSIACCGGPPEATPTPSPTPTPTPTATPPPTPTLVPIAVAQIEARGHEWRPLWPPHKDITFTTHFDSAPVVVINGDVGWKPVIACALNIENTDFDVAVIDHNGNEVTSATVNWLAVPEGCSTLDPGSQQMILREYTYRDVSQRVEFPLAFDTAPTIVNNAHSDEPYEPYIVLAADTKPGSFIPIFVDHERVSPAKAWLQTLAVGPGEPDPNLMIQARSANYSDGDFISFPYSYTAMPTVIANACYHDEPMIASARNNSAGGFYISLRDHEGNPVYDAEVRWVAVGLR